MANPNLSKYQDAESALDSAIHEFRAEFPEDAEKLQDALGELQEKLTAKGYTGHWNDTAEEI